MSLFANSTSSNPSAQLSRDELVARAERIMRTADEINLTIQDFDLSEVKALTKPEHGYVNTRETFATFLGLKDSGIIDLGILPQGEQG